MPLWRFPPRSAETLVWTVGGIGCASTAGAEPVSLAGYDLRPRAGGRYAYGMLPPGLFEQLRRGILELQHTRKARMVSREE